MRRSRADLLEINRVCTAVPALTALTINFIELSAVIVVAIILLCSPRFARTFDPVRWATGVGTRRGAVTGMIVFATLASALLASTLKPAVPRVHDEFCYLLTADTFASGRVTNPTHPLWPHFETFHTIHQPSYQAKYPPGQGLFLALGQVLTGSPVAGVWISMIAAALALYWCLGAWMPGRWALVGALIPCIRFGSADLWESSYWMYWSASFWGGGVALLGAALMAGALRRLWRGNRAADAVLLGVGLGLLAASRPLEGLLAAAVTAVFLFWGLLRRLHLVKTARVLLPTLVVVLAACGLLAHYNWRVTGSPQIFPYTIYTEDYDVAPLFAFQELGDVPFYRHREMKKFHTGFMIDTFHQQAGGLAFDPEEWVFAGRFFVGPALGLITLVGLWWKTRWGLYCALMMAVGFASHQISSANPSQPHYFAPFVPAMLLLTLRGVRVLRMFRFRQIAIGRQVVNAALLTSIAVYVAGAALRYIWAGEIEPFGVPRVELQERLSERPLGQLVIVRYGEHHNPDHEWVFNGADIDGAKVVWAREMDPASNERLLKYFDDREVWLLEPDLDQTQVTPYPR